MIGRTLPRRVRLATHGRETGFLKSAACTHVLPRTNRISCIWRGPYGVLRLSNRSTSGCSTVRTLWPRSLDCSFARLNEPAALFQNAHGLPSKVLQVGRMEQFSRPRNAQERNRSWLPTIWSRGSRFSTVTGTSAAQASDYQDAGGMDGRW